MDEKSIGVVSLQEPSFQRVYVDGAVNQKGSEVGLVLISPEQITIEKFFLVVKQNLSYVQSLGPPALGKLTHFGNFVKWLNRPLDMPGSLDYMLWGN